MDEVERNSFINSTLNIIRPKGDNKLLDIYDSKVEIENLRIENFFTNNSDIFVFDLQNNDFSLIGSIFKYFKCSSSDIAFQNIKNFQLFCKNFKGPNFYLALNFIHYIITMRVNT